MIHQPMFALPEGSYNSCALDAKETQLKRYLNSYKQHITRNAKVPKEELDKAFKQGQEVYFTANQCLKYGIATDKFTTWNCLYKAEHISFDENSSLLYTLVSSNS